MTVESPHGETMHITEATKDDVAGLCELLELLFAQEAEFRPDRSLQSTGLQQIIDFPERGRILIFEKALFLSAWSICCLS